MAETPRPRGRTRLVLSLTFGGVAMLLLLTHLISRWRSRELQHSVDLIVDNALASVQLVERMGMDLEREKILLDQHILEDRRAAMDEVEAQLGAARADYQTAARLYGQIANFPGEAEAWRRLSADAAALRQLTDRAMVFSRDNHDAAARAALAALEPAFAAVDQDVNALVAINQRAAAVAALQVRGMQRGDLRGRMGITAFVILSTLLTGLWVTRRVLRAEEQTARYALALEAQNRELDAFAARVAHDLRGPLTTISISAATLSERLPREATSFSLLQRGVQRMESLIEDLLTLSRIDGPQGPQAMAKTEVVASAVEEELSPKVSDVDGALLIEVQPAQVRCSEGLLREVLWNLGENAVKYRRHDVPLKIEVSGLTSADRYEFRVSDNGSGMSADEARNAFEPFFRGEQARSAPGTGLGLSIVRRIVESNGGTVSIDSQTGQGTTFVVRLPLS